VLQEQILSVRLQARAQPAPRAVEAQRAAATAWLEQHLYLRETHGYNCAPLIDQLARANGNALQLALQMRLPALALLLLASCATAQATLTTPTQLFTRAIDTPTAVIPISSRGNYKFKKPVSITVRAGTGNVATPTVTGVDKTGQHAQALTTGPGSPVTASSKKGSVPWGSCYL
jgi:hypothetical protein